MCYYDGRKQVMTHPKKQEGVGESMETYHEEVFQQLQQTGKVNPYTIFELKHLLTETPSDLPEIDRLCFSIAGNLCDDRPLWELQSSSNNILWYDYLMLQIYIFLKKKGGYKDNHTLLTAGGVAITQSFANDLFTRFGVDNNLIPLMVSLILCIATKISAESWCSYYYDKIKNNELLSEALKEMTNTHDSGEI